MKKSQLERIRLRLGLPNKISEYRSINNSGLGDFFDKNSTFAIYVEDGKPNDSEVNFLAKVREAIDLIRLSELGFSRRWSNSNIGIASESKVGQISFTAINSSEELSWYSSYKTHGKLNTLRIDENWKSYHLEGFFIDLVKIINGKYKISKKWRSDIKNAAKLGGQSQASNDLPQAFLWNMIAIEALLTSSNDKYSQELSNRVEAFIGWTTDWKIENFDSKIKDVYEKRSAFVHSGDSQSITIPDLLFTDKILMNVFYNICKHIDIFKSKQDIIDFSRKIQAEKILGFRPKVRPKTMMFISPNYSERDLNKI